MNIDETIKAAAVAASITSIATTILLFATKELIETRRRIKNSAITLSLFSSITIKTLKRNSLLPLPFGMSEILNATTETINKPESSALLSDIEEAIYQLNGAAINNNPINRELRESIIKKLTATTKDFCKAMCIRHIGDL